MKRRTFVKKTAAWVGGAVMTGAAIQTFISESESWKNGETTMPVLFVGHGAPLYTLDDNPYSRAWRRIAQDLPTPRAILCISAHWLTRGSFVTAMNAPRTIHDFGRMDDRLFEIQYPAPGAPELAAEIARTLAELHIQEDHAWGLDHGCWCVARCMYPEANIPILQFSIDYNRGDQHQYELGKRLAFLRQKGVLVLCSGNIVHNLRVLRFPESSTYDWAIEFDELSKNLIEKGDHASLVNWQGLGNAARLSIPTPDHYYPLLYALGMQTAKDAVSFPTEGIAYGSTSMRSVLISEV